MKKLNHNFCLYVQEYISEDFALILAIENKIASVQTFMFLLVSYIKALQIKNSDDLLFHL
jgi:hypothetical protein